MTQQEFEEQLLQLIRKAHEGPIVNTMALVAALEQAKFMLMFAKQKAWEKAAAGMDQKDSTDWSG